MSEATLDLYRGSPINRSLSWSNLTDAELRRRAMAAASTRDQDELWSLLEAYVVLHGRPGARTRANTLVAYRYSLGKLLGTWQGVNLLRPQRDAALQLPQLLHHAGLGPRSIELVITTGRQLYKALRWADASTAAPFDNVKAPRDPTPPEDKRRPYSSVAVQRLIAAAEPVDRCLVLLGAHGGLRVSEIVELRWSDLRLEEGRLRIRDGKGGKAGDVRLSQTLVNALRELRAMAKSDHVMPYRTPERARRRMQNLCNRAGVTYLGIHALRHYCGTRLYEETSDLRVPAKHLRHAKTSTTEIYAKFSTTKLDASVGQW